MQRGEGRESLQQKPQGGVDSGIRPIFGTVGCEHLEEIRKAGERAAA